LRARSLAAAKQDLRGLVPRLGDWLKEIFTLRLAMQTAKQAYPGMADDLAALLPPDFLRTTPFERRAAPAALPEGPAGARRAGPARPGEGCRPREGAGAVRQSCSGAL
jgi:hypothetical protein